MSYSSDQLLEFQNLLSQRLADVPVRGLNSIGVDHDRRVLSIEVRPEYDEGQLARLVADFPPDALAVDIRDEGPYFLM